MTILEEFEGLYFVFQEKVGCAVWCANSEATPASVHRKDPASVRLCSILRVVSRISESRYRSPHASGNSHRANTPSAHGMEGAGSSTESDEEGEHNTDEVDL